MSARSTALQIAAKAGMLLGALFVFTILLAALPAHRPPMEAAPAQERATQMPDGDHNRNDRQASEQAAVHDMAGGDMTREHHDSHSQQRPQTVARRRGSWRQGSNANEESTRRDSRSGLGNFSK
jgi:hypothetical protein